MNKIEYRPWGAYQVLHDTSEAKVKVIEIDPRNRMSYQYHVKRSEEWTVIQGTLTVVLDDMEYELVYGDSISIPSGSKHRAWNKTDKPVRFVEVQTGTYFGEDDIVRLEDDYNRE